jgi:hypothetical protein
MIDYNGSHITVRIPAPNFKYLNKVIGSNSFEELHRLVTTFGKSASVAKELTESYSSVHHLQRSYDRCKSEGKMPLVLHIGDGSRFLTAAMTTLFTKSVNISIDPNTRLDIYEQWKSRFKIRNLSVLNVEWQKAHLRFLIDRHLDQYPGSPVFVSAVHAHIDLKHLLGTIPWNYCYSLACCEEKKQLPDIQTIIASGEDMAVLSPKRKFKVYCNGNAA